MAVYKNYFELIQSNLFDAFVYDFFVTPQSGILIFLLMLFQGPLFSFIPLISLFLRSKLESFSMRILFSWGTIVYTFLFGQSYWCFLLFSIELLRIFLLVGLMPIFQNIHIPNDNIGETALKRIVDLIKNARNEDPYQTILKLIRIQMQYRQGDDSDPFTENDIAIIKKFFQDFAESCFLFESNTFTVFFPTFVIHRNSSGLKITSDKAIQLNLHPDTTCAICRESIQSYGVILRCQHEYCLNCIYSWLNQEYTCPLCRKIID
jgi:hypothetical protein